MTMQTAMLATLITILGAAQYALCVQALRDLIRRPRVRGENKVLWALGILCLPIAGAIIYNWMGPTSFLPRSISPIAAPVTREPAFPESTNVTPISAARSARHRVTTTAGTIQPGTPRRTPANVTRIGRTGS